VGYLLRVGEDHYFLGEVDGVDFPPRVQPRMCLDAGSVDSVSPPRSVERALGGSGTAMISSSRWNDIRIEGRSCRFRKAVSGSYFAMAKLSRLAVVVRGRA
jgi:hypothetical protein